MADPVTILLVDDQRLMREGLRTLLDLESGLRVVGEASQGQEALDQYASLQPDVVLMDVRMPVMDGVESTRQLMSQWPRCRRVGLPTQRCVHSRTRRCDSHRHGRWRPD